MKKNKRTGATIVLGQCHGDEGKGKHSAHLAQKHNINYIYRAGVGPNAEHGLYFTEDGPYTKCNQLPLGFIRQPDSLIRIGPGVCVDVEKLFAEIKQFKLEGRVKVDPRCPIVKPEHKQWERENLKGESTYNGCGPCRSDFVLRKAKQARDIPELKDLLLDVPEEANRIAKTQEILVECSQGALLSLALSYDYPHVTSDNVTACAAADDIGLNWQLINEVVMVVKSMPTREANGPLGSVEEMTVEEMKALGQWEDNSIDNGKRRKAKGIDFDQLKYVSMLNGPTQIALSFLDHFDPKMTNVVEKNRITSKTYDLIKKVEKTTGCKITMLETGKLYNSIIDLD